MPTDELKRKEEIEFLLGIIHKFCIDYDACLYPKEIKGTWIMVARDNKTGKEYAMVKPKEE